MGIGSITSTNSMSGMQMLKSVSTDPKIKKIENEIKDNKNKEDELKVKKAELAEKNKEKKYSNAILDYISNSNHTVFYIDEQGKESILKEFFE